MIEEPQARHYTTTTYSESTSEFDSSIIDNSNNGEYNYKDYTYKTTISDDGSIIIDLSDILSYSKNDIKEKNIGYDIGYQIDYRRASIGYLYSGSSYTLMGSTNGVKYEEIASYDTGNHPVSIYLGSLYYRGDNQNKIDNNYSEAKIYGKKDYKYLKVIANNSNEIPSDVTFKISELKITPKYNYYRYSLISEWEFWKQVSYSTANSYLSYPQYMVVYSTDSGETWSECEETGCPI